jgi:predicted small secreted protein
MTLSKLITVILPIALVLAASGLAGCNTTAGFGEDIKAAGSSLERNAEKKQSY